MPLTYLPDAAVCIMQENSLRYILQWHSKFLGTRRLRLLPQAANPAKLDGIKASMRDSQARLEMIANENTATKIARKQYHLNPFFKSGPKKLLVVARTAHKSLLTIPSRQPT